MNDPSRFPESQRGGPSRPPLGEELLPPVEQPSAKFIIQLFVVPALIVMGIVAVWLALNWLVRSATIDPNKLIEGIERGPSVARWQRASELAEMLNSNRYPELKQNKEVAAHLAQILDREIDQSKDGKDSQQDATLRYFLTSALGEFQVDDGVDALLKAAATNRGEDDKLVRRAAIEAIAVRAFNIQQLNPPQQLTNANLDSALVKLSQDEDPEIRLRAAFALGKLGTPAAIQRLEVLVNDPNVDTRTNAAIALAHRGNAKAVETLVEMLDLSEPSREAEKTESADKGEPGFKKAVVIASAIDAAHALARQNPQADLSSVVKAFEQLVAADAKTLAAAHVPPSVGVDAKQALELLKAKQ